MRIWSARVEQINHPKLKTHPSHAKISERLSKLCLRRWCAQHRRIRTTNAKTSSTACIAYTRSLVSNKECEKAKQSELYIFDKHTIEVLIFIGAWLAATALGSTTEQRCNRKGTWVTEGLKENSAGKWQYI
jgi:hypothetical protein